MLKAIVIQMMIEDGNVKHNLKRLEKFIELTEGDIYLTPELSLTGFKGLLSEDEVLKMAGNLPCVGLGFRERDGDKKYNTYLISCNGKLVYKRRKHMLFKPMQEHEELEKGGLPEPFELKGIRLAVNICYELRFPELFWPLSKDVHAFIVPAAWPKERIKAWRSLVRARAIENFVYVLGINRWGKGIFGPFGGNSLGVYPNGNEIMLSSGEGIAAIEIDPSIVTKAREFPAFGDRIMLMRSGVSAYHFHIG